jgi:hypothetical protein
MPRLRSFFSLGGEDPNRYQFGTQTQSSDPYTGKPVDTRIDERNQQIAEGIGRLQKGVTDWSQAMTESTLSKLEGKHALRRGMQEAGVVRKRGETLLGQNKLIAGASGTDPSSGSNKLVEDTLIKNIESDASQYLLEGSLKNIKAKFEANQARRAGQSALWGGIIGAGSSFMSAYDKGQ